MINCSFCGNTITKDRYNFVLKGERQDFPPNEDWQEVYEIPREDVCPKCKNLILSYFEHILENIRKNKGKLKVEVDHQS